MKEKDAIELLKSMQSPIQDYADMVGAPAWAYGHQYVYANPEDYAIEEAITALEEKQNLKWIPVEEQLPKAKEDVLVCTKSGWILIAWYGPNGQRWHITPADAGITREDIVAWMPLPEQYKDEN